jgi:flagellar biosynthesis protein FlhF
MQIRRFEGKDMQDALRQVKEVLGPEAIILSTKTLKKGAPPFRWSQRASIEVVAAIDRDAPPLSPGSRGEMPPRSEVGGGIPPASGSAPRHAGSDFTCWDPAALSGPGGSSPSPSDSQGPGEESHLIQKILSTGIRPEFVHSLVREIQTVRDDLKGWSLPEVYRRLLSWKVMESVEVAPPSGGGRKIWAMIGPTGVGKTTTLAKLAAYFSLKVTPKVTLITIDTYRIGATEHLKTYARILRLPVEIAENRGELRQIIEKHSQQDLLLIDTAGSSPSLAGQIEQLKEFLTCHPHIENHLLLSATTKDRDLDLIVQRFSVLPIQSYIFTKIDETGDYAPILNQILRNRRPLSYLTNGQRVPEDIESASKVRVANLVLNSISWN